MSQSWWQEPDVGAAMASPVPSGELQGCSAMRMWRSATATLVAPDADDAWKQILDASPPDSLWHSLRNCVAYQAGVWQNLLNKGINDVIQPAAFKLAVVLRHTPTELTVRLLSELLRLHPQSQDLTSYILALLTDDEALWGGACSSAESSAAPSPASSEQGADSAGEASPSAASPHAASPTDAAMSDNVTEAVRVSEEPAEQPVEQSAEQSAEQPAEQPTEDGAAPGGDAAPSRPPRAPPTPAGPAPLRDLQLFGDCELAVLAASREEYDAHAKLVRAEYSKLTNDHYVELRIKVLNQFSQIPKLYHTPEFECFETAARENIEREISTLREHLLVGSKD